MCHINLYLSDFWSALGILGECEGNFYLIHHLCNRRLYSITSKINNLKLSSILSEGGTTDYRSRWSIYWKTKLWRTTRVLKLLLGGKEVTFCGKNLEESFFKNWHREAERGPCSERGKFWALWEWREDYS